MVDNDPNFAHEPHVNDRENQPDPSEPRAARRLSAEPTNGDEQACVHSVHNEPAMRPGQDGQRITRHWPCHQCGYDLRGLLTGQPCPECGAIGFYFPPPEHEPSLMTWQSTGPGSVPLIRQLVLVLAAVACAPLGVAGAMFNVGAPMWFHSIVMGPVLEEIMKLFAITWLIEARPGYIRRAANIHLAALISGLSFATVENTVYLYLLFPGATQGVIVWRWIICTILHMVCSLIAIQSLTRVWQHSWTNNTRPQLSNALPSLIAAMLVHGGYNAAAVALSYAGCLL